MHERLTDREYQMLELAAQGYSTREITRIVWLAMGTVKAHFGSAFVKLGARNRTHAIAICYERGLLPAPRIDVDWLEEVEAS